MLEALGADSTQNDSLERIVHTSLAWMDDQEVPERLGAYRVVREIGRGGLATVYLAERDGEFSRRVAIKLIRRGLDTDDIVERLRRERQILANLDHPYIARMYEGGTSDDGRPYFVMELIEGERIDTWCFRDGDAQDALSLDQRIDLFRKVCEAVGYAHQSLVLHRDIKPSNLMVTADGVPKLLDFGIAKVLQADHIDNDTPSSALPTLTAFGERLLTPEFASPEQVRGEPLTTAGDVYSLGVLLYLLVTGQRPYEIQRARLEDVEKVVCEARPERPSTVTRRLRSSGEAVPLGWPTGSRAEDLDNIVLMALRKEPERRYGSARQLADDLRRFQEDLPITARKDTVGYRVSKFVRRHRLGVSVTALVFTLLVVAVVVTTWQMTIAQSERRRAELQQLRAESVATFLSDLFESANPDVTRGEDVSVREILDIGARRIRYGLANNPSVRADLMMTMAKNYRHWSDYEEAETLLFEALDTYRELDNSKGSVVQALHALAELHNSQDLHDEAETKLLQALAIQQELPEDNAFSLSKTLGLLAHTLTLQGRFVEAESLFEQALALHGGAPESHPVGTDLLSDYGAHWVRRQKRDRAVPLLRRALEGQRRHDNLHSKLSSTLNNLAILLRQEADFDGAIELYEEIVEKNRRFFGDRTRRVAAPLYNLGIALLNADRLEEAASAMEEALSINLELFGEQHSSVARVYHGTALVLRMQERYPEARESAEKAFRIHRAIYGDDHKTVLNHRLLIARLAVLQGDANAEAMHLAVLEGWRRVLPPGHSNIAASLGDLGRLNMAQGKPEAAEALFREALEIRGSGSGGWRAARSQGELAWSLMAQGRLDEAKGLLIEARQTLSETLGPDHIRTRTIEGYWSELQAALQQLEHSSASPSS